MAFARRLDRRVEWGGVPWLWAAGPVEDCDYAWFATDVELPSRPAEAWLALAADTSCKLFVNDRFAHMGPPREVPPFFYYDVLDISAFLREGVNRLRILAHHMGVPSHTHVPVAPGLMLYGRVRTPGGDVDLGAPDAWMARRAVEYRPGAHRLGSLIGFAEHYDVSRVGAGEWAPAAVVGRHPRDPLTIPLERDLPLLEGAEFSASVVHRDDAGTLLDMGREVFGFVELEFSCAGAAAFEVRYGELLMDGDVDHRRMGLDYRDAIDAPAGSHTWRSYEKRAFRYVRVTDPGVRVAGLRVLEYGYPYPEYAPADDTLDERIRAVSARTIALCSDDLLNDCPTRERAQYLDPYFWFGAMHRLFGTVARARRYLRQFARGARECGALPMCYPSPPSTSVIPDFSLLYAEALRKYHALSGDAQTVHDCYPVAVAAVERLAEYEDSHGLLTDVPGWVFLDNSFELAKRPRSAALNAVYSGSYAALALLASVLERGDDVDRFTDCRERVRNAFRHRFLRGDRVLDADSTPEFEQWNYWNFHVGAEAGPHAGEACVVSLPLRLGRDGAHRFRLSFFEGCRAWFDGRQVLDVEQGGGWTAPPLFNPHEFTVDAEAGPHELRLELERSNLDWEFHLACRDEPEFGELRYWLAGDWPAEAVHGQPRVSRLRRYYLAPISQVTVGYAAYFGLLDDDESPGLLRRCLPARHYANYRKRTTPFFVEVTDDADRLRGNVLPCNVPASLYFFVASLSRNGMQEEARGLLRDIYGGMLDRGATSWWEEWRRSSSLCHAWGAFAAEYL